MTHLFQKIFGRTPLLIGMVHTSPLPGAPRYDRAGGMAPIRARALAEAQTLRDAGFDALLFCNEADMPYQTALGPQTVAAMTDIVAHVTARIDLPHGVNLLLDPAASIAVAHATGGRFVRAFLTGGYIGDIGLFVPDGAGAMRLRAEIGGESVLVMANATPGFASALDSRRPEDIAHGVWFLGGADAVIVGGPAAGLEADDGVVARVRRRLPDQVPLVIGTGVGAGNIARLAALADGFIVGSSIKRDGELLNPVDPDRAAAVVRALARA